MKSLKKAMVLLAVIISCLAAGVTVQAASGKKISLKSNVTYKYDVTGDRKKDKLLISVSKELEYNDMDNNVSVYVNGKLAYRTRTKPACHYAGELIILENQKPFLYLEGWYQNGPSCSMLLQYRGGAFKVIENFGIEYKNTAGYQFASALTIKGNNIVVESYITSCIVGEFRTTHTLVYKNGTLSKPSAYRKITSSNPNVLKLRKSIKLYSQVGNKGNSFTAKKGANLKITRVRMYGGKCYFEANVNGRKGWFTHNWGNNPIENRIFEEIRLVG